MNGVKGYPADVMHCDKTHLRLSPGSGFSGVLDEQSSFEAFLLSHKSYIEF